MTVLGHIENGTVVLDERVELPEGAQVRVEILEDADMAKLHPEIRKVYGILRHVEDMDQARLEAIREKHLR